MRGDQRSAAVSQNTVFLGGQRGEQGEKGRQGQIRLQRLELSGNDAAPDKVVETANMGAGQGLGAQAVNNNTEQFGHEELPQRRVSRTVLPPTKGTTPSI